MKSLLSVVSAGAVLCALSPKAFADTWYVDAAHYNPDWHSPAESAAGGYGGTTTGTAFGSIQLAVDAASANDTIKVLPGVYNQGSTNGYTYSYSSKTYEQQTRVLVTKKLTIESTGGKDVTRVEGHEGTNSLKTTYSRGYVSDGVSCFMLTADAKGSVFRGFTFYRGWPQHLACGARAAGGICMNAKTFTGANDFLVTDSTFDYCFGRGAGGISGGTAIRCLFTRCVNEEGCNAAYGSRLFNCIASRNNRDTYSNDGLGARVDFINCTLVNCTGVNSHGSRSTTAEKPDAGKYYNCVFYANREANADPLGYGHRVIQDGSLTNTSDGVTIISGTDVTVMTNLCVCPAWGDYAPVKGGLLDGTGDKACLADFDWIPADELNKDFYGKPLAADAPLPIGAILPAAEVKSGYLTLNCYSYLFDIDGEPSTGRSNMPIYLQSREWPCQVRLAGTSRSDLTTHAKMLYVGGGGTTWRSKYDTVVRTLPPKGMTLASALTVTPWASEFFVGGKNANDANNGLSTNAPLATISAAIAKCAAQAQWTATVIHVAPGRYGAKTGTYANEPGDYDTDSAKTGLRASINVPAGQTVMIIADEGPDVTFIEGAPDPDSTNHGCGPNAIRAVALSGSANVAICNFTIRNGYSNGTTYSDKDIYKNAGAAGIGSSVSQHFWDCVFTGNHGYSALSGGVCSRCVFSNNTETSVLAWNQTCSSCVFLKNTVLTGNYFGWGVHTYNCSIYETLLPATTVLSTIDGCNVVNLAADYSGKFNNYNSTKACIGSVIKAADFQAQTKYEVIAENPYFNRPQQGDLRLHLPSAATDAGVTVDASGVLNPTNDLCRYIIGDINNEKLIVNEKTYAGAVADVTPAACCYIDPVNGNDANTGFTEATALRTLQAAMTNDAHLANDRFIALPGTYAEGSGLYVGRSHPEGLAQATVKCRVVVPAGVKLISRDGPEKTIIVGAADTETDGRGLGLGPNAIRCAFVEAGAVLSGFTLTGGRSDYYVAGEGRYTTGFQDNFYTGGVLGRHYDTAICENCIITNNISDLGGAGGYIALHGCYTADNIAYRWGGFLRYGKAYNTFVGSCRGAEIFCVGCDSVNCTFAGEFRNGGSTSAATLFSNVPASAKFWNTVVIPTVGNTSLNFAGAELRNLVIPKGCTISGSGTRSGTMCTNVYTIAELAALYPGGRPSGRTVPSVDTGDNAALAYLRGDQDAAGAQRVMNGTIDVGAFEYDWRGDYAQAMNRRVTVSEASANVVEDANGVLTVTGDGGVVFSVAGSEGQSVDCALPVMLTGGGTIRVRTPAGVVLASLSASGTLVFPTEGASSDFVLEYVGEGSASFAKMSRNAGALMIVR